MSFIYRTCGHFLEQQLQNAATAKQIKTWRERVSTDGTMRVRGSTEGDRPRPSCVVCMIWSPSVDLLHMHP